MLCEKCQIYQATIHLTEIIKDVKSELHLCEHCAKEVGLNSKLSNFTLSVPEMLSFLEVNDLEKEKNSVLCHSCGLSYADFRKGNLLGCPDCYVHFRDSLESIILNHHGEKKHIGKNPATLVAPARKQEDAKKKPAGRTVLELLSELERAVREERYEEAAVLRDRLRELE